VKGRLNPVVSLVIFDLMSDITRILSAIDQGDPHAAEKLLPLVYVELRQLAAQPHVRFAICVNDQGRCPKSLMVSLRGRVGSGRHFPEAARAFYILIKGDLCVVC